MPFRPGVDDDGPTLELIELWKSGSHEIESRLSGVFDRLQRLLRADPVDNANTILRLQAQARRLEELQDAASHIVDGLARSTQTWIDEGGFQRVYAAGGAKAGAFSFTAAHQAAVQVLALDTFDDVLVATQFIDNDSKRFVRDVGRRLTGFKLTTGTPAKAQARELARELKPRFERRGMGAVVYRDGSRHSFGEYAEMLIRTKTGMAYNLGTLNQSRALGVQWFEILDGALCGVTSHHDPELANGKIVDYQVAVGYPLAHPNCRRSINPRPDIRSPKDALTADSVQLPAARADQKAFEEQLRAQAARRRSRARRTRRSRPNLQIERAKQRRRAEALNNRRRDLDRARAILQQQKDAARVASRPGAETAKRWGVTEEQLGNARAVVKTMKADIREVAGREADDLASWLFNNDLDGIERPPPLQRKRDIVTGRVRSVRTTSGYDWVEQLSDAELARVRRRYEDLGLRTPDLSADKIRRLTGQDFTDDEAMDWLVDRWLHEDALRSLSSGRVPKYGNINDLLPADYDLEGYRLDKLFGVDLDDAAGHIASVQAEAAERYARSVLRRSTFGPDPWEMDAYDYLQELEATEQWLSAAAADRSIATPETIARVRARLRELAPPDIDPDGALHPFDLLEQIRITARMAGYVDDVVEEVVEEIIEEIVEEAAETVVKIPHRVTYRQTAGEKRLSGLTDIVDELHGARPNSEPVQVVWGTGGDLKGGHFTPATRGPKPRRPKRSASETDYNIYRARYQEWVDTAPTPEVKVIKRKVDSGDEFANSFFHEMGHYGDWDPDAKEYVSVLARRGIDLDRPEVQAMSDFLEGARSSTGWEAIDTSRKLPLEYKFYLKDEKELWARAYAQWATEQSGHEGGKAAVLAWWREQIPGFHWEDDEFAELISPLVEGVLRGRGVLE